MLGVFLLLAFTRLGHECQDLLSLCDGMYVCTDYRAQLILSSERVLGNGVRTHVNSKGKIPSTRGSAQDWTRDAASGRTASPTHYQLSYSCPSNQTNFQQGIWNYCPVACTLQFPFSCHLELESTAPNKETNSALKATQRLYTQADSIWEQLQSFLQQERQTVISRLMFFSFLDESKLSRLLGAILKYGHFNSRNNAPNGVYIGNNNPTNMTTSESHKHTARMIPCKKCMYSSAVECRKNKNRPFSWPNAAPQQARSWRSTWLMKATGIARYFKTHTHTCTQLWTTSIITTWFWMYMKNS